MCDEAARGPARKKEIPKHRFRAAVASTENRDLVMKKFDVDLTPAEKEKLAFDIEAVCKQHGLATGPVKQLGHMVMHRLHLFRSVPVLAHIHDCKKKHLAA